MNIKVSTMKVVLVLLAFVFAASPLGLCANAMYDEEISVANDISEEAGKLFSSVYKDKENLALYGLAGIDFDQIYVGTGIRPYNVNEKNRISKACQ